MSKLTILLIVTQLSIVGFADSNEVDRITLSQIIGKETVTKVKATNEIVFTDGFVAEKGSDFLASIHAQSYDTSDLSTDRQEVEKQYIPSFGVYPNPTSGSVQIVSNPYSFDLARQLIIYNLEGKMVKHILITSPAQEIDLSTLENGLYLAKWNHPDDRSMVRIVKK